MKLRTAGAAVVPAVLALAALAVRAPYIIRVGPSEGGGDEWFSAWRSLSVLAEGGNPGNFLHPALYYDLGGLLFAAAGRAHDLVGLLALFVQDETKFLRELEWLSAACGGATVAVVFQLGKRLFGATAGGIAAVLLIFLPLHIEYSQRARVDALFTLCVAACGLAFLNVEERGRRRDSLLAGLAVGLATAANYPGVLLLIPLAWIHWRKRALAGLGIAILTALMTFAATNPLIVTEPRIVLDGIQFQARMAWHVHPYREDVSPLFYGQTLVAQGKLFCIAAALALVWAVWRGGLPRVLAVSSVGWMALFAALSTQFDRYVLPPLPWLCVLVAGLAVQTAKSLRRFGWAAPAIPAVLVVLTWLQSERAAMDRISPQGIWQSNPREERQQWLIDHVNVGATVWLEADTQPLLQATFADPGGPLAEGFQQAVRRIHPKFDAKFIKGERVERSASFDPALITGHQIQYAVTCDRFAEYAHQGDDSQAAFYDHLGADCRKVFSTQDGCWIAACP